MLRPTGNRSVAIKVVLGICVLGGLAVGAYFAISAIVHSVNSSSSTSTGNGSPGGGGANPASSQSSAQPFVNRSDPVGATTGRTSVANLKVASTLGDCTSANCVPPLCFCAGTKIPGGLSPDVTPQFIMLTFDDYLSGEIWKGVIESLIFETTARDATGCRPRLTFYLNDDLTDYDLVDSVYSAGSEVAIHTVDHANPTAFTVAEWARTTFGAKRYMSTFTSVPEGAIVGNRAPWLIYSDAMFSALYEGGFLYDSSVIERHDSLSPINSHVDMTTHIGSWLWPYTLDFGLKQICPWGATCPKLAYPGLWEVPMCVSVDFRNPITGYAAEMDPTMTGDALFNLLVDNFESRYKGNRAPMGIFLHAVSYLVPDKTRVAVLQRFYQYVSTFPGVVFATPTQIIEWTRNPKPIDQLRQQPYLSCPTADAVLCQGKPINTCTFTQGTYSSCKPCPSAYPTVANAASP